MVFKFKRYKVWHDKKDYYIFVPELIKDNLWINTLNDDWWGGPFLTGSVRAMRVLSACFALMGFNPYAIIYLPIKDDLIPEDYTFNPENGNYDVVFRTNRTQMKDRDWKEIRGKLQKTKWTRYKLHFQEKRCREYFKKDIELLMKAGDREILRKAGADMWLSNGTVFCSYPRSVYRRCAVDTWEYIREGLEKGDIGGFYDERNDYWTADMLGGMTDWGTSVRRKQSYERPGVHLNLEIYDIKLANRRLKKKDRLVKCDRSNLPPRNNPAMNVMKIIL